MDASFSFASPSRSQESSFVPTSPSLHRPIRPLAGALAAALLLLAAAGSPTPLAETPPLGLLLGVPATGSLAAGGQAEFRLRLDGPAFVRLVLESRGGEIVPTLTDAAGRAVATAQPPAGGIDWLALAAVTGEAGDFGVRLAAPSAAGSYRLTLTEARPRRPDDDQRLAAEEAYRRGYWLLGRSDEPSRRQGLAELGRAAELWRRCSENARLAEALEQQAQAHLLLGEYSVAEQPLAEARRLASALDDPAVLARVLRTEGLAHRRRGELAAALDSYERALAAARRAGDAALEAKLLNHLGALHHAQGDMVAARDALSAALAVLDRLGDDGAAMMVLANLGAILARTGQTGEARRHLERGLQLLRAQGNHRWEMAVLRNLAELHRQRGEMREALAALHRTRELAIEMADPGSQAAAEASLGALYRQLREPERAARHLERALEIYREVGARDGEAAILSELGWHRLAADDPQGAASLFRMAAALGEELEDRRNQMEALHGQAAVELAEGGAAGAAELLARVTAHYRSAADVLPLAEALRDFGRAVAALDRPLEARRHFEEALALARELHSPELEASAQVGLALLARRSGDLAAATAAAGAALELLEAARHGVPGPELRATFHAGSQQAYELYIDLRMERAALEPEAGHVAEAFRAAEASRARSLAELLTEAGFGVRPEVPAERAEEGRELAARLSRIQRRLIEAMSMAAPDAARLTELRTELAEAEADRQRLEAELRSLDPRYASLRYRRPIDAETVRRRLPAGTALLEYELGESRSFLFVVTAAGLDAVELPPAGELGPEVRRLRDSLATAGRRGRGRAELLSRRLYGQLVAPAEPLLTGVERLLIAADHELHYLPFEVLVAGDPGPDGAVPHLVRRWTVSYVPSATIAAELAERGREPSGQGLVAFADPRPRGSVPAAEAGGPVTRGLSEGNRWSWPRLPFSRSEVAGIAALLPPGEVQVYLGDAASEEAVKSSPAVAAARWLHFASHALVDEQRPAHSGLVLSPPAEGGDDGLLQAWEIAGLRLSADTVVLSACETGLGRWIRGEGLIALTRPFLYAGARRVVVSLWQVADRSTGELMVRFYRRLGAGEPPARALRSAKLSLLAESRFRDPFYWAPFVLVEGLADGTRDPRQPGVPGNEPGRPSPEGETARPVNHPTEGG